jgi:hypothetical protein
VWEPTRAPTQGPKTEAGEFALPAFVCLGIGTNAINPKRLPNSIAKKTTKNNLKFTTVSERAKQRFASLITPLQGLSSLFNTFPRALPGAIHVTPLRGSVSPKPTISAGRYVGFSPDAKDGIPH